VPDVLPCTPDVLPPDVLPELVEEPEDPPDDEEVPPAGVVSLVHATMRTHPANVHAQTSSPAFDILIATSRR
jgi:hypothetical protein